VSLGINEEDSGFQDEQKFLKSFQEFEHAGRVGRFAHDAFESLNDLQKAREREDEVRHALKRLLLSWERRAPYGLIDTTQIPKLNPNPK
jgi:hypothetical protein